MQVDTNEGVSKAHMYLITMKVFVVLFLAALACGNAYAYSLQYKEGDRYAIMPDGDGKIHVVDMHIPLEEVLREAARYNPANDNIYNVFTRQNPNNGQRLWAHNGGSLSSSNYASWRPTKIVMHGWNNNGNSDVNIQMRNGFLAAQDCNVIVVDWGVGANANYVTAVTNVVRSGVHVAEFVDWLIWASGGNVNNFHFTGHSLGGHQAGIAARNVRSGRIPYITGMDPAMPGWNSNNQRLTANDGNFVEVIHSNAGVLGITEASGDVDFYPNGGTHMPGCSVNVACSHGRAFEYMAESLTNNNFVGRQCSNIAQASSESCSGATLRMGGINAKAGSRGIYHVFTNANRPFARG